MQISFTSVIVPGGLLGQWPVSYGEIGLVG